jgi:hypothetical protein
MIPMFNKLLVILLFMILVISLSVIVHESVHVLQCWFDGMEVYRVVFLPDDIEGNAYVIGNIDVGFDKFTIFVHSIGGEDDSLAYVSCAVDDLELKAKWDNGSNELLAYFVSTLFLLIFGFFGLRIIRGLPI